jgi:hypothetical protein
VNRAVVHILGDQPIVADLLEEPKPGDLNLLCTNVRTLDGKRPVFIDHSDSTFIFPYTGIRFVEIPTGEGRIGADRDTAEPEELEIDEDFLRRVRDA